MAGSLLQFCFNLLPFHSHVLPIAEIHSLLGKGSAVRWWLSHCHATIFIPIVLSQHSDFCILQTWCSSLLWENRRPKHLPGISWHPWLCLTPSIPAYWGNPQDFFTNFKFMVHRCTKCKLLLLIGHLNYAICIIPQGQSFMSRHLSISPSVPSLHHCTGQRMQDSLPKCNGITFFHDDHITKTSTCTQTQTLLLASVATMDGSGSQPNGKIYIHHSFSTTCKI